MLRYHGGKFRIADWVLGFLPPHECYVEPFAGAGSVFFRKPRSSAECLNYLDERIVNVYRVLRDPARARALMERLQLTPFARAEFEAAYEATDDPVEAAARTITLSFMGQGSDAVTRGFRTGFRCALRNRDSKALPSHEWADWPDSIGAFCERLKGVAIENTDGIRLIGRLDSPSTLFYVDPPYPFETRAAARGRHGYRHEMETEHHEQLAAALQECRGMVAISGYPCTLYDETLYPGWQRHEIDAVADRNAKRTEVIWLNPACAAAQRQRRLIG